MAINYRENSVFCTADITLLSCYFRKAAEDFSLKDFRNIDKETSKYIIENYIDKVILQLVHDCSCNGHWKKEKDFIVLKAHYWCFLGWMTTVVGPGLSVSLQSVQMNTTFYLELVKSLKFEQLMMQCLFEVDHEMIHILTQELMTCVDCDKDTENENVVLQVIEFCLDKLCSVDNNPVILEKSHKLLQLITHKVDNEQLRLKIVEKIAEKMKCVFQDSQKKQNRFKYNEFEDGDMRFSGQKHDVFSKKQNFVVFEENIKEFLKDEISAKETWAQSNVKKCFLKTVPSTLELSVTKINGNKLKSVEPKEINMDGLNCLTSFVHELLSCNWKTMFSWVTTENGRFVIEHSTMLECHKLLVDIFSVGVSLQKFTQHNEKDIPKLQDLVDILELYIKSQATEQEKDVMKEMLDQQEIDNIQTTGDQDEEYGLNIKLEEVIFRIEEKLFGNEKSFEWLLLTEELYHDERWLKCVVNYSKSFASISTAKMLLDILCVLNENVLHDTQQEKVYKTLQQVVLDTVFSLSFLEQVEVVLYNFELTCAHFGSYDDQSLFVLHNDHTIFDQAAEKLTIVMNKVVNKSGDHFPPDVLVGVSNAALISPYMTLKTLLNKAVKHVGCEKVICELLQMFPKIVYLKLPENDPILIKVLGDIMSHLSSKKEEGQFLKLIAVLLQPMTIHPDLGVREPALLFAPDVMNYLIQPLLPNTEDNHTSLTLVLNIFITILDCSCTSGRRWILNEKPFEVLFVLLEMFQDCAQFWEDWASDQSSEDGTMERDDFALDEAWTEMNVVVKILEEHLIPLLTEDILERPDLYKNQSAWIEDQLNNLDWFISVLVLPLLHHDVVKCTIKLPVSLVKLVTTDKLNILPLDDQDCLSTFWTMYCKSCALSNEILGICLAKLENGYPEKNENSCNQEIIQALAKVLPFSTWSQWQRLLNITKRLFQFKYINDPNEKNNSFHSVDLPTVDGVDVSVYVINTSNLLVSVLECIANKLWATPYVLNTTIKNYVSEIKQLLVSVEIQGEHKVYCHLLAHLCHVAFDVVPEKFQESIVIVILDVLNKYLSNIAGNVEDEDFHHIEYLRNILSLVPEGQTRLTMLNKIHRILPNFGEN